MPSSLLFIFSLAARLSRYAELQRSPETSPKLEMWIPDVDSSSSKVLRYDTASLPLLCYTPIQSETQRSRIARASIEMKSVMHTPEALVPKQALHRSLRLRLILWYGSLIAVALGVFALLFLLLTTDAIDSSVNSALRTEARVAMLDVLDDLSVAPPYWPGQLTMHVVDTYRDPGVVV